MHFADDEAREYYNLLIIKGRSIRPTFGSVVTIEGLKKAEKIFDEMEQEDLKESTCKEKPLDYYFNDIEW